MKEDIPEKTKCCTIQSDKLERKQCIKKCKSNNIKGLSWKSNYICGTQNATKKEMNQAHVPFAEQ